MTDAMGPDRDRRSQLAGLRVLELGSSLAVRFCGRILADLGVEVLIAGDGAAPDPFFSRGKSRLDIEVQTVLDQVDAVLESRWPGNDTEDARLEVLQDRPRLRIVSLSNFGRTGPLGQVDGSEILAWARSGYMSLTGDADREPLMVPNQGAVQAAVNGVIGLLASLHTPDASARERWIDVSVQESLAYHLAGAVADAVLAGVEVRRVGNRVAVAGGGGHNYTAVRRCRDGYVLCSVTSGTPVRQLLDMMGLTTGPDTEGLEAKPGHHWRELDDLCGHWVSTRTRTDVVAASTKAGLHWASVDPPTEVVASAHLHSRQYFGPDGDGAPRHPFRLELAQTTMDAQRRPAPQGRLPLSGKQIVEIGTMVAGPYAAALLADLGATVIKVEPPGGDILRRSTVSSRRRWWFHECNRQKESVCLDLNDPAGLAELHALVAGADAVLHNLRPGVAEKLGFDETSLRRVKPDLVVVQVSAFGAVGPDGTRKGTNSTVDAASGLAAVTGYRNGLPLRPGNIYCDMTSALYATVAVLAGLYTSRTGVGSGTDLAMLEVAAYGLGDVLAASAESGTDPERRGNSSPRYAPHGCYPCEHGRWMVLSVEDDTHWRALASVMADALPEPTDRRAALDEVIARWTAGWDRDELVATLNAAGVPAAPVLDPEELIDEPQLSYREFYGPVDGGADGLIPVPRLAVLRGSDRAPTTRAGAPELGEERSPSSLSRSG
jgi:crotonobetainyl-CoA:carnitine CoA-transferase CaiB-like acyl-CoA transferase